MDVSVCFVETVQGHLISVGLEFKPHIRPIYIGKNQNIKNLGFLLHRLHCQKNP